MEHVEHKITGEKIYQHVDNDHDRFPEFDPRSGEHLWVVIGTWKVNPVKMATEGETQLDRENLLGISVPGCFYCEQPYTKGMEHRRCKGEPPNL